MHACTDTKWKEINFKKIKLILFEMLRRFYLIKNVYTKKDFAETIQFTIFQTIQRAQTSCCIAATSMISTISAINSSNNIENQFF